MFKNMRLVILSDMFLNPSFKMATSFANIARTTLSTSKFIYQENFKLSGIGSFYETIIFNFEWTKTSLILKFSLQTLELMNVRCVF